VGDLQHQRLVAGEFDFYEFEKPYLRKDGSLLWALGRNSAVRDDEGKFLFAVQAIQDVTERQANEERYRSLFEAAPIGIALWDERRDITAANPAFGEMVGQPAEAIVGQNMIDLVFHETLLDPAQRENSLGKMIRGELSYARADRQLV
jgi:PAS domain-containing protein